MCLENNEIMVFCRRIVKTNVLYRIMNDPFMLVIYLVRTDRNLGAAERLRKKKALEELMTLRAIKQDSQCCPKCRVRIMRSQGCNHMKCTNCNTHFCYRCGTTLDEKDPYRHFKADGCPTFDKEEVQRMVDDQRHNNVDQDLEDLRRQFGRQEELFEQFHNRANSASMNSRSFLSL